MLAIGLSGIEYVFLYDVKKWHIKVRERAEFFFPQLNTRIKQKCSGLDEVAIRLFIYDFLFRRR